jgi:MtN3 and saliva related transmembrane protein
MTECIGWFAAAVLLATIGRQVYSQWRDGSTKGLSRWLFIGQITASLAFVVYSWLRGRWGFVVTNVLMLGTAVGEFCAHHTSGRDQTDGMARLAAEGAEFLPKPYRREQLLEALRHCGLKQKLTDKPLRARITR